MSLKKDDEPNMFDQANQAANSQMPAVAAPFVMGSAPATTPGTSQEDEFYFGELQVPNVARRYSDSLEDIRVWDDGVVKGFILVKDGEIKKLFVEPVLQGQGIGARLLEYAVEHLGAKTLWALEKNEGAIRFYQRHGFRLTGEKQLEDGTSEYLVQMQK